MKNKKSSSKKQPVKVSVVLDISQQLKEMKAEFNNAFVLTDKGIPRAETTGPFRGYKAVGGKEIQNSRGNAGCNPEQQPNSLWGKYAANK